MVGRLPMQILTLTFPFAVYFSLYWKSQTTIAIRYVGIWTDFSKISATHPPSLQYSIKDKRPTLQSNIFGGDNKFDILLVPGPEYS